MARLNFVHVFFLPPAPYVNYIQKDPGAPCSLTEALEYLQVDILEDLIKNDTRVSNQKQPPKNKPHNFTVVAMEGCHSFIILDWGRPLKDDMVSGKKKLQYFLSLPGSTTEWSLRSHKCNRLVHFFGFSGEPKSLTYEG